MRVSGLLICDYLWVAFYVLWMVWALRTKQVQSKESIKSRIFHRIPTIAAFCLIFLRFPQGWWIQNEVIPDNSWIEVLGVVLAIAGIAFAIWARAYLGGNWSSSVTVKVEHQLIQSGPYRWVRHPIYTGLLIALLGTAMELREIRGLLAVPVLYVGLKIKSMIEERTMMNTFGPQYEEYSRHTGAIVPKLI